MAKLNARARKSLPSSSFVFPKTRSFPINDMTHARMAVDMAARKSPAMEMKIDRVVHRKFPSIQISKLRKK